jgi:Zinc knuckle/Retrotransposon gag protein
MLLYLEGNKDVLKTDKDWILVVLSYLDSEYTGVWAMAFLEESIAKVPINFGRWDDFLYRLSDAFEKTTKAQDAYMELNRLYQGTKTAEEYWLHFEALCIKAEFDKVDDYKTLFRIIMTHMNKPLIDKCFGAKNIPTTIAEWKKKTINYDRGWRQCKEIFESAKRMSSGPSQYTPQSTNEWKTPAPKTHFENVPMDVNTQHTRPALTWLSDHECIDLQKKGACFRCWEVGHMSHNCPQNCRPQQAVHSMNTIPAPKNDDDDKDAMIASLMDRIKAMEAQQGF